MLAQIDPMNVNTARESIFGRSIRNRTMDTYGKCRTTYKASSAIIPSSMDSQAGFDQRWFFDTSRFAPASPSGACDQPVDPQGLTRLMGLPYIYIYIRQSIDWHHPWPDRSSYTSPRQVVSGLTQIINDPPNDPNLRVHSLCDCHGTCTRPACDVSGFGGEKVMQSAEHHG